MQNAREVITILERIQQCVKPENDFCKTQCYKPYDWRTTSMFWNKNETTYNIKNQEL